VENNLGVHRGIILLQARIINLIADKIQLDGVHRWRPLRRPRAADLEHLLSAEDASPSLALDSRAKDLHHDLLQWRFRLPTIALDERAQLRSLATWHACNILIEELYGAARDDPAVQGSVDCILELCAEATSGKIEYLNSVSCVAFPNVRFLKFSRRQSLMMAGIQAITAAQRVNIRSLIQSFEFQCGEELQVLLEVLEESWSRADAGADDEALGWRQILLDIGKPVLIG
jgi:hypothetical protein